MMKRIAWIIGLAACGTAVAAPDAGTPLAVLKAAGGTRLREVRTQTVVVGDFKADASYAFTTKDGRRVSGHVIAREYPLADAPAIWVQDADATGSARAFVPTSHALLELTLKATGGPERIRERLRWRRSVVEPGAGLARRISEPVADGLGYRLRSNFQLKYRALTQAASTTYVWVSGEQLHVVTHWVSKARSATEASALLQIMEHLLPAAWPGNETPTQLARAAGR